MLESYASKDELAAEDSRSGRLMVVLAVVAALAVLAVVATIAWGLSHPSDDGAHGAADAPASVEQPAREASRDSGTEAEAGLETDTSADSAENGREPAVSQPDDEPEADPVDAGSPSAEAGADPEADGSASSAEGSWEPAPSQPDDGSDAQGGDEPTTDELADLVASVGGSDGGSASLADVDVAQTPPAGWQAADGSGTASGQSGTSWQPVSSGQQAQSQGQAQAAQTASGASVSTGVGQVVAFESLTGPDGAEVASHSDLDDAGQTVNVVQSTPSGATWTPGTFLAQTGVGPVAATCAALSLAALAAFALARVAPGARGGLKEEVNDKEDE